MSHSSKWEVWLYINNIFTLNLFYRSVGNDGHQMHKLTLHFNDPQLEEQYANKRDSSFKFYVGWTFVIFLFMTTVHVIVLAR